MGEEGNSPQLSFVDEPIATETMSQIFFSVLEHSALINTKSMKPIKGEEDMIPHQDEDIDYGTEIDLLLNKYRLCDICNQRRGRCRLLEHHDYILSLFARKLESE